jgi:hypothetical protein
MSDDISTKILTGYKGTLASRNEFRCTANTIEELNVVIDLLRKSGILIHSVSKEKNSLEDMFMNLIEQKN